MAVVDSSSTFNAISRLQIIDRLSSLGHYLGLSDEFFSFFTNSRQRVYLNNRNSSCRFYNVGVLEAIFLTFLCFFLTNRPLNVLSHYIAE